MNSTEHEATLTAEQRIRRAASRIPGGWVHVMGITSVHWTGDTEISLDEVADYLEQLGDRLRVMCDGYEKDATELAHLRRDLAAFRRIMGTAPEGS